MTRIALVAAVLLSVVTVPVTSTPADQFVKANGVALQYLDWGGQGDVLLFLAGLGDDVHRFDTFAPRFSDRFHVVGFSRRGQGASDFVINRTDNPRWREVFEPGYKSEQVRIFKRDVKRGRVVEFHDTDHFFFADPKKTDTVVAEIRLFLSQP